MSAILNHGYKLLVGQVKWLFSLTKQCVSSKILKVLLQWCFFGMECTRNGFRLLFRIFECVIWFRWVFTERVEIGYSGLIGYINALGHLLEFQRTFSHSTSENVSVFLASEIYLQRVKRFLSKKMKLQWNEVLSVDYLYSINCWATLADL